MRTRYAVIGMVVALGAGAGIGASGKSDKKSATATVVHTITVDAATAPDPSPPAPAPADPPPPPPPAPVVRAKPNAKYTSKCEYLLGDSSSATKHGYRFVSSASVHNTGNIGIVAVFETTWRQAGAAPVRVRKRFKLARGKTKFVTLLHLATSNEIEQIQAVGYDQQCASKVSLRGTFGKAKA